MCTKKSIMYTRTTYVIMYVFAPVFTLYDYASQISYHPGIAYLYYIMSEKFIPHLVAGY